MKTIQRLTLCALFALCSIYASAYSFLATNDDGVTIYYNIVDSSQGTCEVTYYSTSYKSYSGSVSIPETVYDGYYTVVGIGSSAFENCTGLTSIDIPNSMTTIGERAFEYCSGLTSLPLSNNVTTIGEWGHSHIARV